MWGRQHMLDGSGVVLAPCQHGRLQQQAVMQAYGLHALLQMTEGQLLIQPAA